MFGMYLYLTPALQRVFGPGHPKGGTRNEVRVPENTSYSLGGRTLNRTLGRLVFEVMRL